MGEGSKIKSVKLYPYHPIYFKKPNHPCKEGGNNEQLAPSCFC